MDTLDLTKPLAYRCDDTKQVEVLRFKSGIFASYDLYRDRVIIHRDDGSAIGYPVQSDYDLVPLRFRVTGLGVYRTLKGYEFHVLCIDAPGIYPVIGYVIGWEGNAIPSHRTLDGKTSFGCQQARDCDLVERIK